MPGQGSGRVSKTVVLPGSKVYGLGQFMNNQKIYNN